MFRGTFDTDEAIQKNEIYYPGLLNKTKQNQALGINETIQLSLKITQLSINNMAKSKGLFPGFYEIYKSYL